MARASARHRPDPDETITWDAAATPRGARIFCFLVGAALVFQHLLMGVLATPFFGGEAYVWGSVLGAFVLSTSLGFGGGGLLARLLLGGNQAHSRLVLIGGLLVPVAAWSLPHVARFFLDRGYLLRAPVGTFGLLLVVPGVFLAASVPAIIAASAPGVPPANLPAFVLRRVALALLGGTAGLAIATSGLRFADEARVWLQLDALGAVLVVLAAIGLSKVGRVVSAVLLVAVLGLVVGAPTEIRDVDFEVALTEAFVLRGVGRYYAKDAPERVLSGRELERRLDAASRRLDGVDKKIAVLLVAETLKTMGPLNVSGQGLRGLLDIYLPPDSKPLVLPFVEKIAAVKSDGQRLHFTIVRSGEKHQAEVTIAGPTGEKQDFAITDDFDLFVTSPSDRVTKLEIGPQTISKAGLFEVNDTITSPFKCKNVALWIDASLLAIVIENERDRVVLKAQAQASVGSVQTKVLQVVDKALAR